MYHPARARRRNQVRVPSANVGGVSWRGKIGPNHLRHPRTDHRHKQRADAQKKRRSLRKWMSMVRNYFQVIVYANVLRRARDYRSEQAEAWALPNITGRKKNWATSTQSSL
jgi:hypothetical protein